MSTIVLSADDDYLIASLVLIDSIISNKNSNAVALLIDDPKEEKSKYIQEVLDYLFYGNNVYSQPIEIHPELKKIRYFSKAAYGRLYAAQYIADKRIIYLDSDMLCLKPIDMLDQINIDNQILAAVIDHYYPLAVQHMHGIPENEIPSLLWSVSGFNSGMLVINTTQWNFHNLTERSIHWLLSNQEKSKLPDQAVLNYLIQGNFLRLNEEWNYCLYHRIGTNYKKIKNVNLLHFNGEKKPWNYRNVPFSDLWLKQYYNLYYKAGKFKKILNISTRSKLFRYFCQNQCS